MKQFFRSYRVHLKETLRLAWPVVLGQLAQVILQFADYVMIGRLEGNADFSAASIANNIFVLVLVLGIGLLNAIGPLVAEAKGNKNDALCGLYLRQGIWVAIFFSIILMGLTFLMAELIPYMDQPEAAVQPAQEYLYILGWSILPVNLLMVYKQFTEGLSFMKPAMVLGVIIVVTNIFGNWLLIFGNWGFPEMGLRGAGIATLISRYLGAVLLVFVVIGLKHFRVYKPWPNFKEFDWPVIFRIAKLGAPIGFQYLFEVGAFGASAMIAGWVSMEGQVAHQIALNLATLTYMVASGIATATAIRVGSASGAKRMAAMRKSGFAGIWIGGTWMVLASIGLVVFRQEFPLLFKADPEVVALASKLLLFAAFFQVADGVQAVAMGALRGLRDVNVPFWITLVAFWVFGLPVGWFLGLKMGYGVPGIWIGLAVSLTFSALFLTLRFGLKTRVRRRGRG